MHDDRDRRRRHELDRHELDERELDRRQLDDDELDGLGHDDDLLLVDLDGHEHDDVDRKLDVDGQLHIERRQQHRQRLLSRRVSGSAFSRP